MIKLKMLRDATGLSQKSVAAELHLDYKRYNHYETGRSEPDIATLILLADYFGVTVDYLIGHEKEPTVKDDGLTETERAFISLSSEQRQDVLRYMEFLIAKESGQ